MEDAALPSPSLNRSSAPGLPWNSFIAARAQTGAADQEWLCVSAAREHLSESALLKQFIDLVRSR